jgi:hypothetical protein
MNPLIQLTREKRKKVFPVRYRTLFANIRIYCRNIQKNASFIETLCGCDQTCSGVHEDPAILEGPVHVCHHAPDVPVHQQLVRKQPVKKWYN